MEVIVESGHADAAAPRDVAENRLRFALRRLGWRVNRARLRLADINGPRGGMDKEVRIELHLSAGRSLVVSAKAMEWRAAIDRALDRAVQKLLRSARRSRQPLRVPMPEPV